MSMRHPGALAAILLAPLIPLPAAGQAMGGAELSIEGSWGGQGPAACAEAELSVDSILSDRSAAYISAGADASLDPGAMFSTAARADLGLSVGSAPLYFLPTLEASFAYADSLSSLDASLRLPLSLSLGEASLEAGPRTGIATEGASASYRVGGDAMLSAAIGAFILKPALGCTWTWTDAGGSSIELSPVLGLSFYPAAPFNATARALWRHGFLPASDTIHVSADAAWEFLPRLMASARAWLALEEGAWTAWGCSGGVQWRAWEDGPWGLAIEPGASLSQAAGQALAWELSLRLQLSAEW